MKKVLVIGATGCMGSHLVPALLKEGYMVDGVTLDDANSSIPNLRYIKTNARDINVLKGLLENNYDGIIDFLHYADVGAFEKKIPVFLENTEHYIFLSSYRVYADTNTFLTEASDRLTEKYTNDEFLINEDTYGVRKCQAEDCLNNSGYKNYSIVRPVVVYGENRYPITTWDGNIVPYRAQKQKKLLLPLETKDKGAALVYAGDIAKEFVKVLFNKDALGQTYTFGSPENLTWGQVADICEEVCGLKSEWIPTDDFVKMATGNVQYIPESMYCMMYYDRLFNRQVNIEKVLTDTGLKKSDFISFVDGLKRCYSEFPLGYQPTPREVTQNEYMDSYIQKMNL